MPETSHCFDLKSFSPKFPSLEFPSLKSFTPKAKLSSLATLLLSMGASIFFSSSAQAVETIQLRYYGSDPSVPSEVTLTLDEIKQFVQSGELRSQAKEFFNINQQDPAPIQRILTEQIQVPSNFGQDFVDSSVGRFVVLQLEKLIQGSNALPDLRTAIKDSIQDDRNISLLEIIEKYPAAQVSLNVTGLVRTYGDVSSFVDRVLPALEVAKEYLQGIICDCQQAPATGKPQSSVPQSSAGSDRAVACSSPTASSPAASAAARFPAVTSPESGAFSTYSVPPLSSPAP